MKELYRLFLLRRMIERRFPFVKKVREYFYSDIYPLFDSPKYIIYGENLPIDEGQNPYSWRVITEKGYSAPLWLYLGLKGPGKRSVISYIIQFIGTVFGYVRSRRVKNLLRHELGKTATNYVYTDEYHKKCAWALSLCRNIDKSEKGI